MGNREKLIALALKYRGEYENIKKAILNNEKIIEVDYKNCLTILDDTYPQRLKDLKKPPLVLFYKGNINLLKEKTIGVVGSRKPCDYSIKCTELLTKKNKDRVIVSGLAKGIDGVAHLYAEKTIAVLGCGIDYIYPYENVNLFKQIEKEGLILSEYPYNSKPYNYHFPFRNRIIAALADELYVMQASNKSGTLITINYALELNKEVKVLPFSLFENNGQYNNYLIQEGASLINQEDLI